MQHVFAACSIFSEHRIIVAVNIFGTKYIAKNAISSISAKIIATR